MSSFPGKQKKYTYEDYLKWDDNNRYELIEGVPYLLASPSVLHQTVVGNIYFRFKGCLNDRKCKVFTAPLDVLLPQNEHIEEKDIDVVVQPDIFIVCDESKIKGGKNCKGAPDMIIEVLSPATASRDFITKQNLYERAGVKEYWVVSPEEKNIVVFRMDERMKYNTYGIYGEDSVVEVRIFPDLTIPVKDIFV
ncbi:Endonuclease, Uma2 family (restriction endonuclease fold) [Caldanaerobius fijiensis DSM 17918]|uniref:Endonuclease, Uma2 family (Restriction endonuclease fold) n=1 Tax=Caldanaerobius fijiensis DSM 17918 TaxID=1121256 RepID=A0A1M5F340_9THEO|nr:Uma2 family endonuclease [Caldanaerobius fijiensis]SHF85917.1 Endonuclease, Uma2 family (restriction endonuclease fold) [Caldanaerobius fijiensis DSM 17918]